ncbi:YlxR family protein, partial [Moorena sp. SIO2C4]|uniref:YlxR family protein n=2 Tax=Coleofasciculaceae TaxID=1892251 RepID=UPI00338E8F37
PFKEGGLLRFSKPKTRMKPNYRRCLSCRKVAPKQEFWRIVRVYPSRKVQLDQGMGRSAYLCPQLSCLAAAQKKNRLGRSLRASVPKNLYETLWQRLATMPTKPNLGN